MLGRSRWVFGQQGLQVKRARKHCQHAASVTRPLFLRSIPVQLDSVAIGVAKVEGLADAMIRRTLQLDARLDQPPQSIGQRRPSGVENGNVVEPRRSRWRWRSALTLPSVQANVMVIPARRQERRLPPHALHDLEAQHTVVERDRPFQVGDFEMDVADAGMRIDRLKWWKGLRSEGRVWRYHAGL